MRNCWRKTASFHTSFPAKATLPERLGATGARFTVSAENVAQVEFIEDVHPALMGSPGHRANILSSSYNAVGIGVVESQGKIYVTQDFIFLVPLIRNRSSTPRLLKPLTWPEKAEASGRLTPAKMRHSMQLACTTDGDAVKLADKLSGNRAVVVFTSSDPHHLPAELNPARGQCRFPYHEVWCVLPS